MSTDTKELIDKLLELEDKATGGPWSLERHTTIDGSGEYDYFHSEFAREEYKNGPRAILHFMDKQYDIDREFIVYSRNNIRRLLLRMRALEECALVLSCYSDMSASYFNRVDGGDLARNALRKLGEVNK